MFKDGSNQAMRSDVTDEDESFIKPEVPGISKAFTQKDKVQKYLNLMGKGIIIFHECKSGKK